MMNATFAAALTAATFAFLTPAPPAATPDISGRTPFGDIVQTGDRISITGHPTWVATGHVRKNGIVSVVWTHLGDGRAALGAYKIDNGNLVGHWAWIDDGAIVDDQGDICSENLHNETVWITPHGKDGPPEQPPTPEPPGIDQ